MASELAERIRSGRDEVVATWQAGVRTIASAAREPQPVLEDHVPAFLDWLADRLDGGDPSDAARDAFSAHHTLARLSQGFDLVEVVAEWAFLRDCLLELWEAAPGGITPAEVRRMNVELDDVIAVSVVEYVRGLGASPDAGRAAADADAGAAQQGH